MKIIIGLLVIALLFYGWKFWKKIPKPELESFPGHDLKISGKISENVKPEISMVYRTTKNECKIVTNVLTGIPKDQEYKIPVRVEIKPCGYSASAAVLQAKKGECDWVLSHLQFIFKIKREELEYTVDFIESKNTKALKVDIGCKFMEIPGATPLLECEGDEVGKLPIGAKELVVNFMLQGKL